jgi:hypothetical protein
MQKLILPLLLLSSFELFGQSLFTPKQRHWEAGLLFGLSNYSGDLAEKSIQISESQLCYGAYFRYFISKRFAVKAHLYAGSISGDDANSSDPDRLRRSLRFNSNILELGAVGEWHILGKDRYSSMGDYKPFFSPYVYLGLGGAFVGAKTEYYGAPDDRDKYLKAPFPEVGQQQRFLLIPMGVGLRYDFNEVLAMGAELGWRPLFTDNLDGVSLNGDPSNKDWYYFGGLTFSFVFGDY